MSHLTCSHRHIGSRPRSVISPHPMHECALGCFLSVFFLLSFYLLLKSFFHLFLIPAMVLDENSMKDPLCNSAIGSMVSLDYVTPETLLGPPQPAPSLTAKVAKQDPRVLKVQMSTIRVALERLRPAMPST